MAGLGDYSKKAKGNRGYKMSKPSLLKMVEEEKKHFLEKDKVGPVATSNEKEIEFHDGEPIIPAPEEKVLDSESYILSKQEKSEKKKY